MNPTTIGDLEPKQAWTNAQIADYYHRVAAAGPTPFTRVAFEASIVSSPRFRAHIRAALDAGLTVEIRPEQTA